MDTASSVKEKKEELVTKSSNPLSIESLNEEFAQMTDDQLARYGQNRPEMGELDEFVCDVPHSAKLFFAVAEKYADKIIEIRNEIEIDDASIENFDDKMHHTAHNVDELQSKVRVFAEMGWIIVRDVVGWKCENNYGVRKDWKVVMIKQPEGLGDLRQALAAMFGGGVEVL